MPTPPQPDRRTRRIHSARTTAALVATATLAALAVGCEAEPDAAARTPNANSPAPESSEQHSGEEPSPADHMPTISKAMQASAALRETARRTAERPVNETDRRWRPGSLRTITLRRTMCNGKCPSYTLTVHPDGRVVFDGGAFVDAQGRHARYVDPTRLDRLREAFVEIDFLGLDQSDLEEACTNMASCQSTTYITVELDETTHQIEHYEGCHTGKVGHLSSCDPAEAEIVPPPDDIFDELTDLQETILTTARAQSYIDP